MPRLSSTPSKLVSWCRGLREVVDPVGAPSTASALVSLAEALTNEYALPQQSRRQLTAIMENAWKNIWHQRSRRLEAAARLRS